MDHPLDASAPTAERRMIMAYCKAHQLDMHGFCSRFDAPCIKKNCRFFGVKTHADRIRAMSDEELAKWLLEVMKHKVACFGEGSFEYTPCRNVEHDCVKCGVEWLKQPVGE